MGDDRAWLSVFRGLQGVLEREPVTSRDGLDARELAEQSEVVPAIGYLARHLASLTRMRAVVELVRSRWAGLCPAEQEWLEAFWPACMLDCTPTEAQLRPSAERIANWMSVPVLMPVYRTDW